MNKFCKGMPKFNQELIENFSYVGRIDPQSIRLNRVNETEEGYCIATFYTPGGVATARVGFNVSGVIVSNGPSNSLDERFRFAFKAWSLNLFP